MKNRSLNQSQHSSRSKGKLSYNTQKLSTQGYRKRFQNSNKFGQTVAKSLANCPSLIRTLKNNMSLTLKNNNSHNHLTSTYKENNQHAIQSVPGLSAKRFEDSVSYRILNQILNSPDEPIDTETDEKVFQNTGSCKRRPLFARDLNTVPQPFDCSEIKSKTIINPRSYLRIEEQPSCTLQTERQKVNEFINQAQIQRKMMSEDLRSRLVQRNQVVAELDAVEVALESMQMQHSEYFGVWSSLAVLTQEIQKLEGSKKEQEANIEICLKDQIQLKQKLYERSLQFYSSNSHSGLETKRVSEAKINAPPNKQDKNDVIGKCVQHHDNLKHKLGPKNSVFMQSLVFNIKVLLPTHIAAPTLFVLYFKLLESRQSKKLIQLLKKQCNKLGQKDSDAVNQYCKQLVDQENIFHGNMDTQRAGGQTSAPATARPNAAEDSSKIKKFHGDIFSIVAQVQEIEKQEEKIKTIVEELETRIEDLKNNMVEHLSILQEIVIQEASRMAQEYEGMTGERKDFVQLILDKKKIEFNEYMGLMSEKKKLEVFLEKNSAQISLISESISKERKEPWYSISIAPQQEQ